jgi:hypothetical protein
MEKAIEKSMIHQKISILCPFSVSGGLASACSFFAIIIGRER